MAAKTAQFNSEMSKDGAWDRQKSAFREWVKADGSTQYPAESGRYHMYVSLACPWAHRAIIVRRLKGLQDTIGLTVVDPLRDEKGWRFGDGTHEAGDRDPLHGWQYLSQGYAQTDPDFNGRITVPTLWDTKTGQVVNNESADVIRMLNSEFNEWATNPGLDLVPEHLRELIDEINAWVYELINNGVYACGFATKSAAYEQAYHRLFDGLDRVENILSSSEFLTGGTITEADWRLFTTLVRFDPVYYSHFKCNRNRIIDMPHTQAYLEKLYAVDGISDTVDMDHIKRHYYQTHEKLNPSRIVPLGPKLSYLE